MNNEIYLSDQINLLLFFNLFKIILVNDKL